MQKCSISHSLHYIGLHGAGVGPTTSRMEPFGVEKCNIFYVLYTIELHGAGLRLATSRMEPFGVDLWPHGTVQGLTKACMDATWCCAAAKLTHTGLYMQHAIYVCHPFRSCVRPYITKLLAVSFNLVCNVLYMYAIHLKARSPTHHKRPTAIFDFLIETAIYPRHPFRVCTRPYITKDPQLHVYVIHLGFALACNMLYMYAIHLGFALVHTSPMSYSTSQHAKARRQEPKAKN